MRIIFATNNEHKFGEIKKIIGERFNGFLFCLKDLDVHIEPEENGKTFEENADIKVKAVYKELLKTEKYKKNDIIVADDTGLCIDYLNGAPGIYSARFLGNGANDTDKNNEILRLLKGVPIDKRSAYFKTVLSVYIDGEIIHFEGKIDGKIAENIAGNEGFGYDSIFSVDGKTYSELGENVKNTISHRARALQKFVSFLENNHNI